MSVKFVIKNKVLFNFVKKKVVNLHFMLNVLEEVNYVSKIITIK